jgi:hypothetical protein
LGGYGVFETLIPTGDTAISASVDGATALAAATLTDGNFIYLVANNTPTPAPEPGSIGVLAAACAMLAGVMSRRRGRARR